MAEVSMFVTVAYDGAPFHGFARQEGLPTVQGAIEDALATALRRPVATVGAGRTDTGVHATGQVVSFLAEEGELPELQALARSIDALTPEAIAVRAVRPARPEADARFAATSRSYRYRIAPGRPRPVLTRGLVWWVPRPLDVDAMRAGAAALIGEHDFRSFCVTASGVDKRTIRSIDRLEVDTESLAGTDVLAVRVQGRSFLHSMVRIIVGTLVEVGRGARDPGWVAEALAAGDRAAAGPTAPPQGLVLEHVTYPEEIFLDAVPGTDVLGSGPGV